MPSYSVSNNLPFIRLYAIDYGDHGCATWSDSASSAQRYLGGIKPFVKGAIWLVAEYDADPNGWRALHGNKQAFFDHVLRLMDDPNRHLHLKTENLQLGVDVRALLIDWGIKHGLRLNGVAIPKPLVLNKIKPIGPRKPIPALPVEVHNSAAFDVEAAWKAMRDLSKGS